MRQAGTKCSDYATHRIEQLRLTLEFQDLGQPCLNYPIVPLFADMNGEVSTLLRAEYGMRKARMERSDIQFLLAPESSKALQDFVLFTSTTTAFSGVFPLYFASRQLGLSRPRANSYLL